MTTIIASPRTDPTSQLGAAPSDKTDDVVLADHLANDFHRRFPRFSARSGVSRWQTWLAVLVAIGLVGLAVVFPQLLFLILVLGSTAVTLTTIVVSTAALGARQAPRSNRNHPPGPADAALPRYTVLVPAYQEEEVIGDLVRCMHALDYPADKLEVLILVEKRDLATKAAIRAAEPQPFIRVLELPPGLPQTKPRSCNAGLREATGDLLVIFDAEDRPEPDQLRLAAAAFATGGPDLACLQAQLLVDNADSNFITRQFALEYAVRYRLTVPGLVRLGLPIPLGGTSNHFRTEALRRLGGWDAWNVTEDADLGMRCQAMGYRVGVVDSVTWGASTTTLSAWVRQRSRWMKGFMLTALVHTRQPGATYRQFRPRGLVTLLLLLAGTPLHYLAQSVSFLLWLTQAIYLLGPQLPHVDVLAMVVMGVVLVIMMALQFTAASLCYGARRSSVLSPWLPVYWVLQWVASWRALGQLITSPFSWEKTPHGAAETAC